MLDTPAPAQAASHPVFPGPPDGPKWLGGLCLALALTVICFAVAAHLADAEGVLQSLRRLGPQVLGLGLLLTLCSLLCRIVRWRFILQALGHHLPALFLVRVYLAGLVFSATPGKLGETARAVLLQPQKVPLRHSVAAFITDRSADVVAVAALGVGAAWWLGQRHLLLELVVAAAGLGGLLAAALLRSPRGGRWLVQPRPAAQGLWRRWQALASPITAWAGLWTGRRFTVCVGLGVLAYGCQALLLAAAVQAVWPGIGLAACLLIFASATLIGAASLLPGGLGAMDAALVWQLQAQGVPLSAALVAAVFTRVCTLWLVWLLGVLALLSFGRQGSRAA